MLLYDSEIWGLKEYKSVEKVHTFALKKLLNVSPRTPNDMAYGETGRFPLYIHSYTACIKYWLRLTTMDISRLPRKAYNMLLLLHNSGKFCWVSGASGLAQIWLRIYLGKSRCATSRNIHQGV